MQLIETMKYPIMKSIWRGNSLSIHIKSKIHTSQSIATLREKLINEPQTFKSRKGSKRAKARNQNKITRYIGNTRLKANKETLSKIINKIWGNLYSLQFSNSKMMVKSLSSLCPFWIVNINYFPNRLLSVLNQVKINNFHSMKLKNLNQSLLALCRRQRLRIELSKMNSSTHRLLMPISYLKGETHFTCNRWSMPAASTNPKHHQRIIASRCMEILAWSCTKGTYLKIQKSGWSW